MSFPIDNRLSTPTFVKLSNLSKCIMLGFDFSITNHVFFLGILNTFENREVVKWLY